MGATASEVITLDPCNDTYLSAIVRGNKPRGFASNLVPHPCTWLQLSHRRASQQALNEIINWRHQTRLLHYRCELPAGSLQSLST